MKHLLSILFFFSCIFAFSQNRADNPLQIQLNLNGVFLKAAGNALADKEVIDLEVKQWEMPGLSLGYHLNELIYVGYAFHPNRNLILTENYSFNGSGTEDIRIVVDHNTGTFHSLNGRISPFPIGIYGSFFFTYVSEAQYVLTGTPINETYEVISSSYTDALNAEWNFKDLTTIGVGLGFNHVTKSGFSFDLGMGVPISFFSILHENIQVINEDGDFDADDVIRIQELLEDEQFYFPVQMYLSVGKNF